MNAKATKKPATFALASMANLSAAAGEASNSPMQLPLSDIRPDPNQPREIFDEEELEVLASSIREKGVLQPIGVRPDPELGAGKWMIVFGERRWRASKLAKKRDIPAFEAAADQRDHISQVIENTQRSALTNSEIAKAVNVSFKEGRKVKEIAALFNMKEYTVAYYRAVEKFPPFLLDRLNRSDVRGLYDVYRQWEKTPEVIEKALVAFPEGVSFADAQRIIGLIGGKENSGFTKVAEARKALKDQLSVYVPVHTTVTVADPASSPAPSPAAPAAASSEGQKGSDDQAATPPALDGKKAEALAQARSEDDAAREIANGLAAMPSPMPFKLFVHGKDGEIGTLITNARAKTPGSVIVLFGEFPEEVPAEGLQIVGVE